MLEPHTPNIHVCVMLFILELIVAGQVLEKVDGGDKTTAMVWHMNGASVCLAQQCHVAEVISF
ncbi:hypothetical protein ACSF6L_02910 [Escherichia coli]|uniref:hypothetical protein n=1 Tax=Escherichia coli TaxID=562 RepID=UPI003EEBE4DC